MDESRTPAIGVKYARSDGSVLSVNALVVL